MAEITVNNVDWRIIEDLAAAVTAAHIDGSRVFEQVGVTSSQLHARQTRLAGATPKLMIRYVSTDEAETVEDRRGCAVTVEFWVVARMAGDRNEGDRLAEMLRLVNAAKNAVETSPPADACYWGGGGDWRLRLRWASPTFDTTDHAPWALGQIKLTVSYTLTGPTAH